MYCRECGKPLLESDKFCSNCGTPVRKIAPADEAMFRKESNDSPAAPKQTAPLPSFRTEEPEPERQERSERLIFETIGDSIKWNTDMFPDKTPKKTEDVDFHWNVSDDEFRNRPGKVLDTKLSAGRSEPSLWSDSSEAEAEKPKSKGLKPSDTNSWDELFEGTRQEDRSTRKAPGVGRSSIEAYWEDMFRRDGADKKEPAEHTPHRRSISRDEIERGIGDEGSERLDQNKLEDTMTLSREEMEGVLHGKEEPERLRRKETRENREVAELASLAAAGIGAGPTFVPEGTVAVTLPEDEELKAPVEKDVEITGEELEKELFREMEEPMSEAQKMRKRQTEKIDKFYTFNKKNEEFQKLLDQEYERFKKSREQEPAEDYGADLYKLGDENFFEDFSNEGASQALEMARARQTFFHTDEFADLKKAMEAEEAAEKPEDLPMSEDIPDEEPAAPEMPEEPVVPAEESAPEEPAEVMPAARRERKQKKSFFGKLFGRDSEPLDREELAAAVAAAGLDEKVNEEVPVEEEAGLTLEELFEEETTGAAVPEEAPAEEAPVEEESAEALSEEVPAEEVPLKEEPAEEALAEEQLEEKPAEEASAAEEKPAEQEEPEEEEPITASIVFEPEEEEPAAPAAEDHFVELVEEEAPAEEAAPEEAPAEAPAEEAPQEEEEEEPVAVTASIVYDPETDTQETIVETEPAESAEAEVPRTTEPTRVYEKGDIPTPTTEEERANAFEENRAAAWDAFFSDDEEVNAGNTFDAENDEEADDEEGGGSIFTSCLAVILVLLLALIVVRLVLPDSIISIKMDQFIEMILNLFRGNAAADLFNYFK